MKNIPVYLDSNVIIDICDGREVGLDELLFGSVKSGDYCYPFSAEQISEITFGNDYERNEQRLAFVERLSNNLYFVHSVYELGFKYESPFKIYETINEVAPIQEEKDLANFITYEQQMEARNVYGIDVNRLNNLNPKEAIEYLNSIFRDFKYPDSTDISQVPRSLDDFIEFNRRNTIEHFSTLWDSMGANHDLMLRDNTIVTLFSLLDMLGFWGDLKKTHKKGSRFGDSSHTFNASHFGGLVSKDKRLIMKSGVVFHSVGIKASTYLTSEFRRHLEEKIR